MTADLALRETWRERWSVSKVSPRTADTYNAGITKWFTHCDRLGVDVFAAEQHHVDAYRIQLIRDGRSAATVARELATVSSFYRHVLRHARPALVDTNPVQWAERPKVEKVSRRDGLDAVQARRLRAASIEQDPRTAALVHLLLGTAVRVSEAVGADVDDLGWTDDGDRTLSVTRKGGVPDEVLIEPVDWQIIEAYLADRPASRFLFATTGGRRMTRQTAYRLIRQVADKVTGPAKTVGPHSLRHTAATLALDAGESMQEVQGMLGHASMSTTQRYDRAARERGRKATRRLGRVYTAKDEP